RAVPDLPQRTLALRTAPPSHRSRLPAHVRRPHARSQDAAVTSPPGAGAAISVFRVKYTLATKLANELVEAADEKALSKTIARYGRSALLRVEHIRTRP